MSRHHAASVLIFGDQLVARREIEEHGGAAEGLQAMGRNYSPAVFANFDAKDKSGEVHGYKEKVDADANFLTTNVDPLAAQLVAASEPELFVKFAGVWQVGFGNDSKDPAALDDDGAIEQLAFEFNRRADYGDAAENCLRCPAHFVDTIERALPQDLRTE